MSVHEIIIPQFTRLLGNVNRYFDKAHALATAKKFDVNVLMQWRLAPDQYPLLRQVQITCDNAKGTAARLAGKTPPVHEDKETTFEELRARIDKTVAYLKTLSRDEFKGWEERAVDVPWMPGKCLNGMEYLTQLGLPNFYFHLNCTYAILRNAGVDIGKMDYLGELPFKDKK